MAQERWQIHALQLQEGAQLWHGLIGEQDGAPVRAKALFERLAELSHPQQLLPRRLLMVLGMHRSGTSAVAGHLCSHGFRAPHDTPPADYNNPTGYWESQSIVRLHTELLAEAQSSWGDPFLPAAAVVGADTLLAGPIWGRPWRLLSLARQIAPAWRC